MRFQRASLPAQVEDLLRQQIAAKAWSKWLPTERELCETMAVSRRTLRVALEQLKNEGVLESVAGLGTRITADVVQKRKRVRKMTRKVGLLMPEPIDTQRPYLTVWLEKLQTLLMEAGYLLHVHTGKHFFDTGGNRALARLVEQSDCDCWILAFSNEIVQRWFADNEVPTLVSGSTYPGVKLPCVGSDLFALCRHAVGTLLGLGHRRICLVSDAAASAGALDAEAGFRSGFADSPHGALEADVLRVQSDPDVLLKAIARLLKAPSRPTALIVLNPLLYITAATCVMDLGLKIPRDLSLMTTYGDPFLSYVHPSPARYTFSPDTSARKTYRVLQNILRREPLARPRTRLVPDYVRGESVGRASGS